MRPPMAGPATACCATSAWPRDGPSSSRAARCGAKRRPCFARFARLRLERAQPAARRSRRVIPSGSQRSKRLARAAGFLTARRSELPVDAEPRAEVVILDTIGELAQLYQIATIVFVGGSLVNEGGHNIIEPAVFGKPIVFGPHMQNFAEIADAFLASGARGAGAVGPGARIRPDRAPWRSRPGAPASARPRERSSRPTAVPARRVWP